MSGHACDNGWENFNADRPQPCRICRPHHYACRTCGATVRDCHTLRPDACCPRCPHRPPRIKATRRRKAKK